ncbi:mitochondrial ribosome-associated GTPase 1-like [Actinia tenebrosa]|uniref:Mitochondrial GTPase 1 n=1 Tax=Actinia tenebrosa TaxID=6105 RepID=A0A6P8JDT5_ACTTE|nr:mitochondrial ribosome-associated GTPase 1-like [Actinia tenebrosa]
MAVTTFVNRAEVWLANSSFRSSFQLPEHFHPSLFLKWFPGHMAKGLRVMQSLVRKCDCVLEIHDSRIPFSGRNPKFKETLSGRPSVLLLNKVDLISGINQKDILRRFEANGIRAVFVDSKAQYSHTIKKVVPAVLDAIKDAEYEGSYLRKNPDAPYTLMVCGLPNTGKSSLINALRRTHIKKGKGTRVGKLPGMTTSIQERILVNDEPKMYMLDTPGVVAPYVPTAEVGMKLALTGCFKDHLVGEDLIADYILFLLNKNGNFEYVKKFGLENPTDNIDFVLRHIATTLNSTVSGGVPDYLKASIHLLSRFRRGELGRFLLDK